MGSWTLWVGNIKFRWICGQGYEEGFGRWAVMKLRGYVPLRLYYEPWSLFYNSGQKCGERSMAIREPGRRDFTRLS
ncbi:hypothetical protein LINPERPRIM_LOCUS30119 [Linum perenne]